jgi:predicted nucleic acid-binding protein
MTRTLLDASVLIAAFRGQRRLRQAALNLLSDDQRLFVASVSLELEVLPKPAYFRNQEEVRFYRAYFEARVQESAQDLEAVTTIARTEAERCGLGAMDALHVAAARLQDADEFVTAEKPDKSIYRTTLVPILYLGADIGSNRE